MADSLLVRSSRDPLSGLSRKEFEDHLLSELEGRVDEVWLFGSYVTGQLGPDSDVDVILIVETQDSFPVRSQRFSNLLDIGPRLDILVYTPAEISKLTTNPTFGFWQNVTKTMRRIR
jgi:predicted nucleotidyltransferase